MGMLHVCLVIYFHPMKMTNPIRPGWFSWANRIRWKPAKLPLPQHLSSRTDGFPSVPFLAAVSWTLESNLLDLEFPVEHELDVRISSLTLAMSTATCNYAQTFSYFIPPLWEIIILLSPTFLSHCWTPNACSSLFNKFFSSNETFSTRVPFKQAVIKLPHC